MQLVSVGAIFTQQYQVVHICAYNLHTCVPMCGMSMLTCVAYARIIVMSTWTSKFGQNDIASIQVITLVTKSQEEKVACACALFAPAPPPKKTRTKK